MLVPDAVRKFLEKEPLSPCLIMGNVACFDYEIAPLSESETWRPHSPRPLECLGILGIIDSVGRCELTVPALDAQAGQFIVGMYITYIERRTAEDADEGDPTPAFTLDNTPGTSDVAWLEALYALPGPRG